MSGRQIERRGIGRPFHEGFNLVDDAGLVACSHRRDAVVVVYCGNYVLPTRGCDKITTLILLKHVRIQQEDILIIILDVTK